MSRFIFALLIAVWSFIAPPAFAEGTDAQFVREVSLSKGNWLWNHYQRMSAEYRSSHTWKTFMESDACFHAERKCTEADWRAVPVSHKILIPVEGLLARVRNAGQDVSVKLSARLDVPTLRTLSLFSVSEIDPRVNELEKQNELLVRAEGATAKRYYDIKEREFTDRMVTAGAAFMAGILLMLFVMLPHVRLAQKESEDDDSFESKLPTLSDVIPMPVVAEVARNVPQTSELPAPSLSNFCDSVYPRSEILMFRSFDETSGIGHAVIKGTEQVYLINCRTKGFTNQFRPSEEFQAIIVSPRYVQQIFIVKSP